MIDQRLNQVDSTLSDLESTARDMIDNGYLSDDDDTKKQVSINTFKNKFST